MQQAPVQLLELLPEEALPGFQGSRACLARLLGFQAGAPLRLADPGPWEAKSESGLAVPAVLNPEELQTSRVRSNKYMEPFRLLQREVCEGIGNQHYQVKECF